jgi:hypothetical protein
MRKQPPAEIQKRAAEFTRQWHATGRGAIREGELLVKVIGAHWRALSANGGESWALFDNKAYRRLVKLQRQGA